jgi:hypothetical protein
VALSRDQKKHLLIGGGVGAAVLAVGYLVLGGKKTPRYGHEERAEHHEKRRARHRSHENDGESDRGDRGDDDRGDRGERKHHHRHHAGAEIAVGRALPDPLATPEGAIWRLGEQINRYYVDLSGAMSRSPRLWNALHPLWEAEILPFLSDWGPFWQDAMRRGWDEYNQYAERWNAIVARAEALQKKERERGR